MKKSRHTLILVLIPMVICVILDYFLKFPGGTISFVYAFVFGIFMYFEEPANKNNMKPTNRMRNTVITSLLGIFSILLLILLKKSIWVINNGALMLTVQIGLAFIFSCSILYIVLKVIKHVEWVIFCKTQQ